MIDPRADGDITVVVTRSGFLIGPTRCQANAAPVAQYLRLVPDFTEAKRVALALANRYGSRAWISRDQGFAAFL